MQRDGARLKPSVFEVGYESVVQANTISAVGNLNLIHRTLKQFAFENTYWAATGSAGASRTSNRISSLVAVISGAYIASTRAGSAENFPGTSARSS